MATPTGVEARLYAAGAKKGSLWGTEVALGATNEIKLIKSPDLPKAINQPYIPLKESNNVTLKRAIAGGVEGCDIPLESYLRYNAGPLGEMIAEIFGTAGTPATTESGVYLHTFQWKDSSIGLFSTYAEEYPGKIYSVPSAKPVKIVFSLQDGIVKIAPLLRGNNVITGSAVNGATQMDALTVVDAANEIRFDQCDEVWLNLDSTDPLSSSDQRTISGLEITYGRGLETAKMTSGSTSLAEAQEEDFSDVRVKLDFPYDDSFNREFFDDFKDGTTYSLIVNFTGGLAGAAAHFLWTLYFPQLRLADKPDLTKSGIVKVTAEFQALEPSAAPTGFTHARWYMTVQNNRATDYLA